MDGNGDNNGSGDGNDDKNGDDSDNDNRLVLMLARSLFYCTVMFEKM
jgi:hypothetical protein